MAKDIVADMLKTFRQLSLEGGERDKLSAATPSRFKSCLQQNSIYAQTGWKRPFRLTICQDTNVLLKIKKFTYDLSDLRFRRYFKKRTGITVYKNELFFSPKSRLIGRRKKYLRIIKAKLQDCWEIYQNEKNRH